MFRCSQDEEEAIESEMILPLISFPYDNHFPLSLFFISKSVLKHIPHWKIKSEMDSQIKLEKTQKHFWHQRN